MLRTRFTRRRLLKKTALATAAAITAPYVRGAHAAGKLSIGFWDHFVPGANDTTRVMCEEWGAKEKVEVSVDYITSTGNKNLLTIAAESQARSGHDILAFPSWQPADHVRNLEPVDDIMAELIKLNGAVNQTVEYLARADGHWLAVPATVGSQIKGPCSRIDLMKRHAGVDVQTMYPAGSPPKADAWTATPDFPPMFPRRVTWTTVSCWFWAIVPGRSTLLPHPDGKRTCISSISA